MNAASTEPDAGWFAVSFALVGVLTAVAATRAPTAPRQALQVTTVGAVVGAWVSTAWWLDIGMTAGFTAGALTAGTAVLLAALARRRDLVAPDWTAAWVAVGTATVAMLTALAPTYADRSAYIGIGIGLLLVALASAVAAQPTAQPSLRHLSAFLAAAGGTAILVGIEPTTGVAMAVASGVGFVAVAAAALLAYRRPASPWQLPAVELAVLASLGAVGLGVSALPDRSLLVPALAVAGVYAAVLGVVTRRPEVLPASPLLLCAAWLTFATEALAGNPEWIVVPIGVTILVIETLLRATLRQRGEDPAPPAIVGLDLVGMAFVVGVALVQTVAVSLWYGVLAVVLGALVATWGGISRVRRRALFGAATVVLAVLLLVGIPLTDVALSSGKEGESVVSGPALWIVIAAIGLVAIMAAAFLEQGRRRVRAAIARVSEITRDWE